MIRVVQLFIMYLTRFAHRACLDITLLHGHRLKRPGPFLIACTHISHLEPTIVSGLLDRRVYWVARDEYFRVPGLGHFLRLFDTISVTRDAPSLKGLRESIRRLRAGELVGIFPEGGVMRGRDTIFRGGPIKRGMCVIAYRANVPILPVVVLGADRLNTVEPWIPGSCTPIRIIVGEPIFAGERTGSAREHRKEFGDRVQRSFMSMYQELIATCDVPDAKVP